MNLLKAEFHCHVKLFSHSIVEQAASPLLIVMKSTIPPGFGVDLKERFLAKACVPLSYLSNPEFLREGSALRDWDHPDRIIIGGDEKAAIAKLTRFYDDIDAPAWILFLPAMVMLLTCSKLSLR